MKKENRIITALVFILAPFIIQAQMTDKISASASISDKLQGYNGTGRYVTVTTVPAGLSTDITYNGSSNLPINAGKYVVVATINDPFYEGSVTDTLVIAKAKVKVNVTNLSQVYDGTLKFVKFSTNPSGLNIHLTYNGSSTLPDETGIYIVTASVVDDNYLGSTQTALTINKATPVIMLSGLDKTYNGMPQGINIETIPEGLPFTVTYKGSASEPVDAGIYNTSIVINTENYKGSVSTYLIIEKAQAGMNLSATETTYDGNSKSVNVLTIPSDLKVNVTYNGSSQAPVKAGTYKIIAEVSDPNYEGSINDTLTILKALADIKISNLETRYSGNSNPVTVEISPSDVKYKLTYDDIIRPPVNAGVYKVDLIVTDTNYQGSVSDTLIVSKKDTSIIIRCTNSTYNGITHSAEILFVPSDMKYSVLYNGSIDPPVNADMYIVEAFIQNKNYTATAIDTLFIYKKFAQIYLSNLETTFDGTIKQPTIKTNPTGLIVDLEYKGTTLPINAGLYILKATINSQNYFGAVIDTLVINKTIQSITWNQDLSNRAIGEEIALNAVSSSGLTVYYTSSNTSVAYIFGSELIITGIGHTTVIAHQDGDNNVLEATSVSKEVVVTQNSIKSVTPIEVLSFKPDIKCWPNPSTGYITLDIGTEQNIDIDIYNQAGLLVEKKIITGLNPTIDLTGLVPGLYFLRMNYINKSYTLKVSKQ